MFDPKIAARLRRFHSGCFVFAVVAMSAATVSAEPGASVAAQGASRPADPLARMFGPQSSPVALRLQVGSVSFSTAAWANRSGAASPLDAVLRPAPLPQLAPAVDRNPRTEAGTHAAAAAADVNEGAVAASWALAVGLLVVGCGAMLFLRRRRVGRRATSRWMQLCFRPWVDALERSLHEYREVGFAFRVVGVAWASLIRLVVVGSYRLTVWCGRRATAWVRRHARAMRKAYRQADTMRAGAIAALRHLTQPLQEALARAVQQPARYSARAARLAVTAWAVVIVALPPMTWQASAADWYWDPDQTAAGNNGTTGAGLGGSGTWNLSTTRWWDGSALTDSLWPNLNTSVAVFMGSAGTVTLGENVTANGLKFKSSGYALTGGTILLDGTTPTITVDSTYSASIASVLDGSAGLTKAGTGTLTLSGTNLYTGGTAIAGGTLVVSNDANLGDAAGGISFTGNGALTISGSGITTAREISLSSGVSATINLAAASGTPTTTVNGGGKITGGASGTITFAGGIYGGLVPATLNLAGAASDYTAATVINNGVTLNLSGATSALTGTTSITLNGGGLTLTNTTAEAAVNRVNNSAGITSNGGTISFTNTPDGATNYAETLGAVSLASGHLQIRNTNANTSPSVQVLALSGLTQPSGGTGTVTFSGVNLGANDQSRINIAGLTAEQIGITSDKGIGPWATILSGAGGTTLGFAAYDDTASGAAEVNGVTPAVGVVPVATTALAAGSNSATTNFNMTTGVTITASTNPSYKTLLLSHTSAATLAIGSNVVSVGGIAVTGNTHVISGAGSVQPLADGAPLYIHVNSGNTLTFSSIIRNFGGTGSASAVVFSGPGQLTLGGTNTFSGGLVLNGGTVSFTGDTNLGAVAAGSNVIVNGNATLTTASTTLSLPATRGFVLNNGALLNFNVAAVAVQPTIAGPVTGSGGWVVTDGNTTANTFTFSNTGNTFTGPVILGNGTNNSIVGVFASIGESASAPSVIRMGSGTGTGTFRFSDTVGTSPLTFNYRQFELFGNAAVIENANLQNASANIFTINTDLLVGTTGAKTLTFTGANNGANSFNGRITDGVGAVVSVVHSSTTANNGTWIFGGNNTYTGTTTLSRTGTVAIGAYTGIGSDTAFGIGGTVTMSGAGLLQAVGGDRTISNPVTISALQTIVGTNLLGFNGVIGGASGLVVNAPGGGGVALGGTAGVNTYAAGTTLTAGSLVVGKAGALGSGTFLITSGSLSAASADMTGANAITNTVSAGAAFLRVGGSQSIEFSGTVNLGTTAGPTIVNSLAAGKKLIFSSNFGGTVTSGSTTFYGTGDMLVGGTNARIVSTTGSYIWNGSGTWTIDTGTANSATTGGLQINNGNVTLNGTTTTAMAFAATTITAGALNLDNETNGNNSVNRMGGKNLVLAGGTLNFTANETAGSTEAMGTLTLGAAAASGGGGSTINIVNDGDETALLTFTTLTANVGSSLNITGSDIGTKNLIRFTTTAPVMVPVTTGLLARVTINGTDFATYAPFNVTEGTLTAFTGYDESNNVDAAAAAATMRINAAPTYTGVNAGVAALAKTINALKLDGNGLNFSGGLSNTATLTLSAGGILSTGGTNTLSGPILTLAAVEAQFHVNTGSTLNVSAPMTGTGGFTKSGGGTLNMSGPLFTSGQITVNTGRLNLDTQTFVQPTATVPTLSNLAVNGTAVLDLMGRSQAFGTIISVSPVVGGTIDNTGEEDVNLISATNAATATTTFGGVIQNTDGAISFYKQGAGILQFTKAQTYDGTTNVYGGGITLRENATLASKTINLNGGNLTVLNNSGFSNNNRLASDVTLHLRGGSFTYQGGLGLVEAMTLGTTGSVNAVNGANTITALIGTGGTTDLTIGNLVRPAGGGTVNFVGSGTLGQPAAANSRIMLTQLNGQTPTDGQFLGAWAVVNNTDYAAYKTPVAGAISGVVAYGSAGAPAYTALTVNTASVAPGVAFASGNITNLNATTPGGTVALTAANTTTGALRFAGAFPNNISFTSATDLLVLEYGGLLRDSSVAAGTTMIGTTSIRGVLTAGTSASTGVTDLIVYNGGAGATTINAVIKDTKDTSLLGDGTVRLIKSGIATLTLTAENTYTGGTIVQAGTVNMTGATGVVIPGDLTINTGATVTTAAGGNIAAASNVTINGAGTLTLTGTNALASVTFNNYAGNSTVTPAAPTLAVGAALLTIAGNSPITVVNDYLAATPTISGAGGLTLSGASPAINVSGLSPNGLIITTPLTSSGGTIRKTGGGTLVLGGAVNHTLAGGLNIEAGTVIFDSTATGSAQYGTGTISIAGGGTVRAGTAARTVTNPVSIAGNMTFGGTAVTVNNLTLSGTVTLADAPHSIEVTSSLVTAAITGRLTGGNATSGLTKTGLGILQLGGTGATANVNDFVGPLNINAGTLQLGTTQQIPDTTAVTVASGAVFNLNGLAETIGSLSGSGLVWSGVTGAVLTVGDSSDKVFSGTLAGSTATFLALAKQGSGTLTLSGNSYYTGATTVNAGTLAVSGSLAATATTINAGALNLTGSINGGAISVLGTGTLNVTGSGSILGAATLTLNSATATVNLNSNSNYSGATTLTAGTINLGTSGAFGTSTVQWNGATVAATTALTGANAIANAGTIAGNPVFSGSNSIEFSGAMTQSAANRTITNNVSSSEKLIFSGPLNLSGTTTAYTLTINGSGDTLITGAITSGPATVGNLTYSGTGTLTLAGTNTYIGGTTNGTTTVNSGTLKLDYAASTAPLANIIPNPSSRSFLSLGSAALVIQGKTGTSESPIANSQTFAGTTLQASTWSTISAIAGTGPSDTLAVSLGTMTRSTAATFNVNLTGSAALDFTLAGSKINNGIITDANNYAFLTVNGSDWAIGGPGSSGTTWFVAPLTAYDVDSFGTATGNVAVTNAVSSLTSAFTVNSLRFNDATPTTLNLASGISSLTSGGLLIGSGAGAVTIGGDTAGPDISFLRGSPTSATVKDLNVFQYSSNAATISAAIVDAVLNKYGTGTLILSSPYNRYNGATNIYTGTLQLGANEVLPNGVFNTLSASASVSISAGATLDLNGKSETINGLAGAGTVDNTSNVQAALTIGDGNGIGSFAGVFANTGGAAAYTVTKIGSGAQTFTNPGTGTGTTTGTPLGTGNVVLTGGSLTLAPAGTLTAANLSGANDVVGSRFTYNGGGILTLTRGSVTTLTYTVGHGSTSGSALVRGGQGTLVLSPTALANLGVSERFVVNGLTSAANVNGMYDPSVVAVNANNADFVQYGLNGAVGFGLATSAYTTYSTPDAIVNTVADQIVNITANSFLYDDGLNNGLQALRITAATVELLDHVTVDGDGTRAGVILNGNSTINGNRLRFGTSEGVIYVGGTAAINADIWGSGGIAKFGAGTLTLGSTFNNFSDTLQINQGAVFITDTRNLGQITKLILAGTGQLSTGTSLSSITLGITPEDGLELNVAAGAISQINIGAGMTLVNNGPLTGTGTLKITGSGYSGAEPTRFMNTSNTFSGPLYLFGATGQVTQSVAFASLGDSSVNPISLGSAAFNGAFLYLGANNLTLNRPIDLSGTTGGGTFDSSGTGILTLNGVFSASGVGAKMLTLTGTNTGDNTFAGAIVNSIAGATSLTKSGPGKWILSGNSSYTGTTTISDGTLDLTGSIAGSTITVNNTGALIVRDGASIGNGAQLTVTGNGSVSLLFDDALTGTAKFTISGGTHTLGGANSHTGDTTVTSPGILRLLDEDAIQFSPLKLAGTLHLLYDSSTTFDTNGTTVTGTSTIYVDRLNSTTAVDNTLTLGGTLSIGAFVLTSTGANGYRLGLGATTLTGAATFAPTSANMSVASASGAVVLTLGGTLTTGVNTLGALSNLTGLNKNTASIWELTGDNTYTGPTTIGTTTVSGGTLIVSGTMQTSALSIVGPAAGSILRQFQTNALANTALALNNNSIWQLRNDANATYTVGGLTTYVGSGTVAWNTTIDVDQATAGNLNHVLTLGNNLTVGGVSTPGYVINVTGNNGYSLAINNVTLSGNGTFNPTTAKLTISQVDGTGNLTLSGSALGNTVGAISNTGNFVKTGSGDWLLTSANTYTGTTSVQNGTLLLGNAASIPAGSAVSVSSVAGGTALLDLNGFNYAFPSLALGTAYSTTLQSSAEVRVTGATLTLGGDVTFTPTGTATGNVNTQGALISGGTLDLGGARRTFNVGNSAAAANDLEITSVITNDGGQGIVKLGAGRLLLSGNNTFTGDIHVGFETGPDTVPTAGGVLTLTGNNNFAGDIYVNSGTLEFATIAADVNTPTPNSLGTADTPITLGWGSIHSTTGLAVVGGGTLNFIGDTSQSTNRAITINTSASFGAYGTNGAVITYNGAITFTGPEPYANRSSIQLRGTGEGVFTGGYVQPILIGTDSSDFQLISGTWTLSGSPWVIEDDVNVGYAGSLPTDTIVLNLNTPGVLDFHQRPHNPNGSGLFITRGGTLNLNADDTVGSGMDFLTVGYDYDGNNAPGFGILNTNTYRITTPILYLGMPTHDQPNAIIGTGTVIVTGATYLARGSISANLAGAGTIMKYDLGNVTLSGDNSGLTAPAITLTSGNLILDYSLTAAPKLPSTMSLVMQGGTLTVQGGSTFDAVHTAGGLDLSSATSSQIVVVSGTGKSATLNLGAIVRPVGGGLINFTLPESGNITTTTPNTGGILGAFATVTTTTGTYFAANDGFGNIVPMTDSTTQNDVNLWLDGQHIIDTGSGFFGNMERNTGIGTLRFDAVPGSSVNVGTGNTLTVGSGVIWVTSNVTGPTAIVGGNLHVDSGELFLTNDGTQTLTISSVIDGEYGIFKAGTGTVSLTGANRFTGPTVITAGTLIASGLSGSAPLTLSSTDQSAWQMLGNETIGSLSGGNSSGVTYGAIHLGANSLTIRQTTSGTYAGVFSGNGTIVKEGAGTELNLTGFSSGFTGSIIVNAGILRLSTINGVMHGTTSYTVNKTGSLYIDSYMTNAATKPYHHLNDNATVTLNSADGGFADTTIPLGLGIRMNGDTSAIEDFALLNFGSGNNYVTISVHVNTQNQGTATFDPAQITRENKATFNLRGTNLGYTGPGINNGLNNVISTRRTFFRFDVLGINTGTGADNVLNRSQEIAFLNSHLIGGGILGSDTLDVDYLGNRLPGFSDNAQYPEAGLPDPVYTTLSIIPWAIGENVYSFDLPGLNITDTNMGNSLLTYIAYGTGYGFNPRNEENGTDNGSFGGSRLTPAGFRPLRFSEYDTYNASSFFSNVREVLTSDLLVDFNFINERYINSLVLHNDSVTANSYSLSGNGTDQSLQIYSGAMLFTLNPSAAPGEYGITLDGFDSGIHNHGFDSNGVSLNEFFIYVVNPNSADNTVNLTATIDSKLETSADITKSGRGTLVLTAANNAGGGLRRTTINEGILHIADLDNIGGDTGLLVFAGGTLRVGPGFSDDLSTRMFNILIGGGTLDTNGNDVTFAAGGLGDDTPFAGDTFTKTGDGLLTIQGSSSFIGTFVAGHARTGTAADGDAVVLLLNGNTNEALNGNLQIGSSVLPTATTRAAVALGADEQIVDSAILSFNGAVDQEAYFKLMGFTETVAGISDSTGYGIIENLQDSESGVAGDGTLILSGDGSYTFRGVLRDKGAGTSDTKLQLVKQGSGMQTLSGPNTFSGGVSLNGGVLYVRAVESPGVSGPLGVAGPISFAGGTLRYSSLNNYDYSSRFSTAPGQLISIDTNGRVVTFATPLTSVGGSLTKTGTGTLTLSTANSYDGGTSVFGGVLSMGHAQSIGTGAVDMEGVGSTLRLNGFNVTIAGLTAAATGPIIENTHASSASKLTVNQASGSDEFAGSLRNGGTALLSFEKTGNGTLELSGANTYTGPTTVSGGVLLVTGSLANTAVSVAGTGATLTLNGTADGTITVGGGGTLQGTGTAAAAVIQSGGTLSVGNSVGQLTIDGNDVVNGAVLAINGGAKIEFEFKDTSGGPGVGWDYVDLAGGGKLDLTGVNGSNRIILDIASWNPNNLGPGAAANFETQTDQYYTWLFIEADELIGVDPSALNAAYADYFQIQDDKVFVDGSGPFQRPLSGGFGVQWQIGGANGTGLYVTFTAVPEPGSMLLAGLGSLAAAWYGKRRRRQTAEAAAAEQPQVAEVQA